MKTSSIQQLALAWCCGVLTLACNRGYAESAAPSVKEGGAEAKAPLSTSARRSPDASAKATIDPAKLVATLTDKRLLPITPENATEKLSSLVVLSTTGPEESFGAWTFQTVTALNQLPAGEVAFAKSAEGKWEFKQMTFRLTSKEGLPATYESTADAFKRRYGKPSQAIKTPIGARKIFWDIKKQGLELGVTELTDPDAGPTIEVSLIVPGGEAD